MLATTAVLLTAAYLAVWVLEGVPALRFRSAPWLRRYIVTDMAWYLVALGATAVSAIVFRPQLQRVRIGPVASTFSAAPGYVKVIVAVAVYDLVAFAIHVGIHRSELLWSLHKVHHSSLHLDGLATSRTHTMELLLRNIPAQLALFAIGASGSLVAATVFIYAIFALIGHSNLDLPIRRLEWLVITPRLHRLHHIPETTQHNFGTIFSVWDHLFGFLIRRDTPKRERTGVPGEITTYPQRLLPALRAPFREMRDARRPRKNVHGVTDTAPAAKTTGVR